MPGDRRSDRRSDVDSPTGSEVLLGTLLQEFMILPVGTKSFKEALCIGCEVAAKLVRSVLLRFPHSLGSNSARFTIR